MKALNDVEDLRIKLVIGKRLCSSIKDLEPSVSDVSFAHSFSSNSAVTVVLLNNHCDETRSIVSRKVLAQRCMPTPETRTDIQIESIGHCVVFCLALKVFIFRAKKS